MKWTLFVIALQCSSVGVPTNNCVRGVPKFISSYTSVEECSAQREKYQREEDLIRAVFVKNYFDCLPDNPYR